ncbi:WecB/TagA/CpsF family glycosyltransferase [Stella sp.]|uniref:WecB/TagA/CpsF family glycosyltransferase n=1 Tax=Stella sp. TaxID=2912054 RepID=UPI0035B19859
MDEVRPTGVPTVAEAEFLGQRLALLDVPEAAATIAARPPGLPFAYVVTPNAQHFVRLGRLRDARFQAAYDAAWLRLSDSRVACVLARVLFGLHLKQAAGSDLTHHMLHHTVRRDDPVTVVGGSEELRRRLVEKFGLERLALHEPPMGLAGKPEEQQRCIDFVTAHPARYVFLAVGAPTSEYLAHRIAAAGGAVGVGLCIGSSLNFATGLVNRAPPVFRRFGLEWLHRLLINPRGHARRVFVDSLPMLLMVLRQRLDPHAYDRPARPPEPPQW